MAVRVKLSGDFRETLMDHVLVNKTATVAFVARDMLPTHHVSWTTDPVDTFSRTVSEDIWVDFFRDRQRSLLGSKLVPFHKLQSLRRSTDELDFSVDRSSSLSEELVLYRNES